MADKLTMIGLEVEHIEDKAKALVAVLHRAGDRGEAASECRPPAGVHGRYRRRRRAGAGGLRRAECARRPRSACSRRPAPSSPARTSRSASAPSAASRAAACCARRPSCRFPTTMTASSELPADAPVGKGYAEWAGLGDPVHRDQPDAEPAGLHRRPRHRARSLRRRHGQAQGSRRSSRSRANSPLPGEGDGGRRHARVRASRCGWCAASRTARRRNGCRSG